MTSAQEMLPTINDKNQIVIEVSPDCRTPFELIVHLLEVENLTISQVAKQLKVNKSTISRKLKVKGYVPGYLRRIEMSETSMLKQVRHKMLSDLATDDPKEIGARDKAVIYGVLLDKQLILEGKPNQIYAHIDMVRAQEVYDEKAQAFIDKYGSKVLETLDADDTIK